MRLRSGLMALGLLAAIGGATAYYAFRDPAGPGQTESIQPAGRVLYWRDPDGKPAYSATAAKTPDGRAFLAVQDSEEPDFADAERPASKQKSVLFYRNPMGLPDTSPVPKKDWMGMDYIPVYEGEDQGGGAITISPERIQRAGVRTETVARRNLSFPVRAAGAVAIDERRIKVVTLRFDGFIEQLHANATGQRIAAGESLFRVYSSEVQRAQADLLVGLRDRPDGDPMASRRIQGSVQRLRNLDIPESRIRDIVENGGNPRTIDWPSPASGTIIEKRVLDGQRVAAGDELYRIADLSSLWVIASVSERDLLHVQVGSPALVTFRAYPQEPRRGRVTFIYPELQPDTRTARVRIEVANPDGRLRADMYADVEISAGTGAAAVVAVPVSAVIDSGSRQVAIVSKGEGRFEPREIKLGKRGNGYIEVLSGVSAGESVVTSANFLIDAESNLKAALQRFTSPESSP
jgi:membrane fusion protein, copper/silver efflux system